jgi:hypothetical protein
LKEKNLSSTTQKRQISSENSLYKELKKPKKPCQKVEFGGMIYFFYGYHHVSAKLMREGEEEVRF